MKFLNPDDIVFERGENGFLRLKVKDGAWIDMVECTPLFPLSQPDVFISVATRNEKESKEIGFIARLAKLSREQRAIVKSEIQFRYFSPEIIDIKKISTKYGVHQWQVITDRGEKSFLVQEIKENIIIRDNGLIVITDIDKCKYQISDFRKLPAKALHELEEKVL